MDSFQERYTIPPLLSPYLKGPRAIELLFLLRELYGQVKVTSLTMYRKLSRESHCPQDYILYRKYLDYFNFFLCQTFVVQRVPVNAFRYVTKKPKPRPKTYVPIRFPTTSRCTFIWPERYLGMGGSLVENHCATIQDASRTVHYIWLFAENPFSLSRIYVNEEEEQDNGDGW